MSTIYVPCCFLLHVTLPSRHFSPFKINVPADKVANASKVKLSGTAIKEAEANKNNEVVIDISQAGTKAIVVV